MADISTEIQNFENAVYGEEVRGSMVSLANKLNTVSESTEKVVADTKTAIEADASAAQSAATAANDAATSANSAATTARTAASSANSAAGTASSAASQATATNASVTAAEQARVAAETGRQTAESARVAAERDRASAESTRVTAEGSRASAENARVATENARVSAEQARVTAEAARSNAETNRASAETARAASEVDRELAESKRRSDFADIVDSAQGFKTQVLGDGEYGADGKPTVTGRIGIIYLVPNADAQSGNSYVEWMLISDTWETIGSTKTSVVGITTDEIDAVSGGTSKSGSSVLSLTGLTYLWQTIKTTFAPKSHASTGTEYGASGIGKYGHARGAYNVTPADITGSTNSVGTYADMYALADHRHALADVSVLTRHLGAAAVTAEKVADAAIGTAKLADASVTSAKMADNAISDANVANNAAIAGSKLADGSIPASKMAVAPAAASDLTTANGKIAANTADIKEIVDSTAPLYDGANLETVFATEIAAKGSVAAWLTARRKAADYSGMHIRDYVNITLTNGTVMKYRIGAFDHYYNCADAAMAHHIVMVPDTTYALPSSDAYVTNGSYILWNTTATNNGTSSENNPYIASNLHAWELGVYLKLMPTAWQGVMLNHRSLVEIRYASPAATDSTSWKWADLGKIWSPSEMEVYGCLVWGTRGWSQGMDSQFPIFSETRDRIKARCSWWLRSAMGGSSSYVCCVGSAGTAGNYSATNTWVRPLPCFLVGA